MRNNFGSYLKLLTVIFVAIAVIVAGVRKEAISPTDLILIAQLNAIMYIGYTVEKSNGE